MCCYHLKLSSQTLMLTQTWWTMDKEKNQFQQKNFSCLNLELVCAGRAEYTIWIRTSELLSNFEWLKSKIAKSSTSCANMNSEFCLKAGAPLTLCWPEMINCETWLLFNSSVSKSFKVSHKFFSSFATFWEIF